MARVRVIYADPSSVTRVVRVVPPARPGAPTVVRVSTKRRRRRGRRDDDLDYGWCPFDTVSRQFADAVRESTDVYLRRHDRSSDELREGWFVDIPSNLYVAAREGFRRFWAPRSVRRYRSRR
ncbi:MAG TPA: hypothetical protein VFK57_18985 [Vicinamibacterales bacterium]|nr:hypothetical protein [Vicinamibacterales bacterium]